MEQLPGILRGMCEDPRALIEAPEYFPSLVETILEFMDRHRERTLKRIAPTAVTEKVFDALDYAKDERGMVMIDGDSRFGKTESVKAWCESVPGLARLVNVPSSNPLTDLVRRVADAFGMAHTYHTNQTELKARVEFVIRHSEIFLVADEGAFLLPQTYGRTTAPARLNWVRTEIVDQGLPFAVVVTAQVRTDDAGRVLERNNVFRLEAAKFIRKTGYVMEQFLGRAAHNFPARRTLRKGPGCRGADSLSRNERRLSGLYRRASNGERELPQGGRTDRQASQALCQTRRPRADPARR